MFNCVEDICKSVDSNKIVYWKSCDFKVVKTLSGYSIWNINANRVEFRLTSPDGNLNGEIWDYFIDEDINDLVVKREEMMLNEIKQLREVIKSCEKLINIYKERKVHI